MYDKTVRRRRAVLALLVALSLILLTAYFGESSGGGLHSLQNGFLTVVSPIQDGADKALKPVRDMFGWFGSTLKAKSQNKQLRSELAKARRQVAALQSRQLQATQALSLYHLDGNLSLSDYHPVNATVVYQSPLIWYATIVIDQGSSAGIGVNDPVIDGEGLIGKVTRVASDGALVSLITDSQVEVTARISATGAVGILQPRVGEPGRLLMQYLAGGSGQPARGDYVVTAGTVSSKGDSLYPKGIPIGTVTSIDEQSPFKSVNVSPLAELHNLDTVQVLTSTPGTRAAAQGATVASLAPGSSGAGEEEGAQLASAEAGG